MNEVSENRNYLSFSTSKDFKKLPFQAANINDVTFLVFAWLTFAPFLINKFTISVYPTKKFTNYRIWTVLFYLKLPFSAASMIGVSLIRVSKLTYAPFFINKSTVAAIPDNKYIHI